MTATQSRRLIANTLRVVVWDAASAKGRRELLNFPCGAGALTQGEHRAVAEVAEVLDAVYRGHPDAITVVMVNEDSGGCVGLGVFDLHGDRKLTTAPYIEALARHDDYSLRILRDGKTTAGGIVLRATLEVIALEADAVEMPEVWATVRETNYGSNRLFGREGRFQARSRIVTNTEQCVWVRPAGRPLPQALDPDIFVPPGD